MSGAATQRKGAPLAMLASLLAVWVLFRVASWESPLPQVFPQLALSPPTAVTQTKPPVAAEVAPIPYTEATEALHEFAGPILYTPLEPVSARVVPPPYRPAGRPTYEVEPMEPAVSAGHQLLWMTAMSQLPLPRSVARLLRRGEQTQTPAGLPPVATAGPKRKRWSIDSWIYLREGKANTGLAGVAPASYGASQAGAVLRYKLAESSRYEPSAYLRATKALAAGKEADVALGLSARPAEQLPLTANAELRATRSAGKTDLRPAAFAVLNPAPMPLPRGFELESYGQAGYVGGHFATGFADGQLRATREVVRFDLGSVRAGAGAWGGAQKGAARLDVGPTASVQFKLGEVPTRLSVDYRVKAAGDADPGSGVAMTLSTGF